MTGTTSERTSGASTFEYAVMLGIVLVVLVAITVSLIDNASASPKVTDPCGDGEAPGCTAVAT